MEMRQQLGWGLALKMQSKATILVKELFFWFSSCSSLDKYKDTGIVHQLTKTAIIIAAAMKKHIKQFILPKDIFVNLLIEKTWV